MIEILIDMELEEFLEEQEEKHQEAEKDER